MSVYDIPMTKALPSDAVYNIKPMAFQGLKRSRLTITPYTAGTVVNTTNNLISFYLPSNRKALLDPTTMYIKYRLTAVTQPAGTDLTFINRNAYSIFNQLTVYHQDSVMLEQINNYNQLAHIICETQLTRSDLFALSPMIGGGNTASADPANAIVGQQVATNAAFDPISRLTGSFAVPVISGFIGLMAQKLVPLWATSDIRIDFLSELPGVAFSQQAVGGGVGANNNATYTVTDLQIVCDIIELTDEAFLAIKQTYNEPLVIASTSFRNYSASIPNGTLGQYSVLVPHRSVSCKQILWSASRAVATGQDSFSRFSPFGGDNLNTYLTLAGIQHPSVPISNFPESFSELSKAWHSFSSLLNFGSINRENYQVCLTTLVGNRAEVIRNQYVGGLDLDQISRRSDLIISGYNSSGINIYLNGNVSTANNANTALGAAITLQTWVMFDCLFILQDGLWSVRY